MEATSEAVKTKPSKDEPSFKSVGELESQQIQKGEELEKKFPNRKCLRSAA